MKGNQLSHPCFHGKRFHYFNFPGASFLLCSASFGHFCLDPQTFSLFCSLIPKHTNQPMIQLSNLFWTNNAPLYLCLLLCCNSSYFSASPTVSFTSSSLIDVKAGLAVIHHEHGRFCFLPAVCCDCLFPEDHSLAACYCVHSLTTHDNACMTWLGPKRPTGNVPLSVSK